MCVRTRNLRVVPRGWSMLVVYVIQKFTGKAVVFLRVSCFFNVYVTYVNWNVCVAGSNCLFTYIQTFCITQLTLYIYFLHAFLFTAASSCSNRSGVTSLCCPGRAWWRMDLGREYLWSVRCWVRPRCACAKEGNFLYTFSVHLCVLCACLHMSACISACLREYLFGSVVSSAQPLLCINVCKDACVVCAFECVCALRTSMYLLWTFRGQYHFYWWATNVMFVCSGGRTAAALVASKIHCDVSIPDRCYYWVGYAPKPSF